MTWLLSKKVAMSPLLTWVVGQEDEPSGHCFRAACEPAGLLRSLNIATLTTTQIERNYIGEARLGHNCPEVSCLVNTVYSGANVASLFVIVYRWYIWCTTQKTSNILFLSFLWDNVLYDLRCPTDIQILLTVEQVFFFSCRGIFNQIFIIESNIFQQLHQPLPHFSFFPH